MKAERVRELDTKELETQVRDLADQMFHLRFQMRMGQQEGLKKYRQLKKDRARMLTVLSQRQAEAAQTVQKG